MHTYFRSVGFSHYTKEKDIKNILTTLGREYQVSERSLDSADGQVRVEVRARVADGFGICLTGTRDDDGNFTLEYYHPYMETEDVSTTVPLAMHKLVDSNMYSALADDSRVGISLIFRVDNTTEYLEKCSGIDSIVGVSSNLFAFSNNGTVIMPLLKTEKQLAIIKAKNEARDTLIQAAKTGDEHALESLTADDMNSFAQVAKRLHFEDIYSIVDNCFMPQGVECDIYQIVADITGVRVTKNIITDEAIYDLTLVCNDLSFHLGINARDLLGEPEVGRRFKGQIWMQGKIIFPV